MKANRIALRPPTVGPCSASPVQRWFGASASNRPNACGGNPFGRVLSSRRTKWRCSVRSSGDQPEWARRIAATCTAVRSGTSRLSAAASSSTSAGVRGDTFGGVGTKASNPPRRQSRSHRSMVARETRTGCPNGPSCSRAAIARTSRPRCRVDSLVSAASQISEYLNRPIARARSARTRSSSWLNATYFSFATRENAYESRGSLIKRRCPRAYSC